MLAFVGVTFAILAVWQSTIWTTGRVESIPLNFVMGGTEIEPPARIWIDTDAACGATPRTDPDDCLAIVWLAAHGFNIAGISTSFGNADGPTVEQTTRSLAAKMAGEGMPNIPVWKGLAVPQPAGTAPTSAGVGELRKALEAGPLTILALGPLTNTAAALDGRPDLKPNVSRIIAVMGHRPGHLFHPAEGVGSGALFGHGPIFRDLNFSVDPDAATRVLVLDLPLVLVPYDAARGVMITSADLDRLSAQGSVFNDLSQSTRGWLAFWNDDVGLPGFYPFDWVAAAKIANPSLFGCAKTKAIVAWEWAFWLIPRQGLIVGDPPSGESGGTDVLYCAQTSPLLHDFLLSGKAG